MDVKLQNIESIKPYKNNPRQNAKGIEVVMRSLREFGFQQPIVVDSHDEIVVGHTRYEAAKSLGMREIPVLKAANLSEEQVRAYRIMDNRSGEYSVWDDTKLIDELRNLDEKFRSEYTGFNNDEITELFDRVKIPETEREEEIPEKKNRRNIQVGDMYRCGEHRIICGDSTDPIIWDRLMGQEKLNLVFTSPPYNMAGGLYDNYADDKNLEEYINLNRRVVEMIKRYLSGYLFYNISYNQNTRDAFIDVLQDIKGQLKFLELIVWRKMSAIPIGTSTQQLQRMYEDIGVFASDDSIENIEWIVCAHTGKKFAYNRRTKNKYSNLWEVPNKNVQEDNHRAAFPVALVEKSLRLATHEDQLIGDPFGGTGTTMVASEKLKRRARLIELDPEYTDQSIERWERYSGQTAEKL